MSNPTLLNNAVFPRPPSLKRPGTALASTEFLGELAVLDVNSTADIEDTEVNFLRWHRAVVEATFGTAEGTDFTAPAAPKANQYVSPIRPEGSRARPRYPQLGFKEDYEDEPEEDYEDEPKYEGPVQSEVYFWTLVFFFPPAAPPGSPLERLTQGEPMAAFKYLISFEFFRAALPERSENIAAALAGDNYDAEYNDPIYGDLRQSPTLAAALGVLAMGRTPIVQVNADGEKTAVAAKPFAFPSQYKVNKIAEAAMYRALRTLDTDTRNAIARRAIFEMKIPTFAAADENDAEQNPFRENANLVLAALNATCVFDQDTSDDPTGNLLSEDLLPGDTNSVVVGNNRLQNIAAAIATKRPSREHRLDVFAEFPQLSLLTLTKMENTPQIVVATPGRQFRLTKSSKTRNNTFFTMMSEFKDGEVRSTLTYKYRPDDETTLSGTTLASASIQDAVQHTHPELGVLILPRKRKLSQVAQLEFDILSLLSGCSVRYLVKATEYRSGCANAGTNCAFKDKIYIPSTNNAPKNPNFTETVAAGLPAAGKHILYFAPVSTTQFVVERLKNKRTDEIVENKLGQGPLRREENPKIRRLNEKIAVLLARLEDLPQSEDDAVGRRLREQIAGLEERRSRLIFGGKQPASGQYVAPVVSQPVGEFAQSQIWLAKWKGKTGTSNSHYVGVVELPVNRVAILYAYTVLSADGVTTRTWSDSAPGFQDGNFTPATFPGPLYDTTSFPLRISNTLFEKYGLQIDLTGAGDAQFSTPEDWIPPSWVDAKEEVEERDGSGNLVKRERTARVEKRDAFGNLVANEIVFHYTVVSIDSSSTGDNIDRAMNRRGLRANIPSTMLAEAGYTKEEIQTFQRETLSDTAKLEILAAHDKTLFCDAEDGSSPPRFTFNEFILGMLNGYAEDPDGGSLPATLNYNNSSRADLRRIAASESPWHWICKSAAESAGGTENLVTTENYYASFSRLDLFDPRLMKRDLPKACRMYAENPLEYIGAAIQLKWYADFWLDLNTKLQAILPDPTQDDDGSQPPRSKRARSSALSQEPLEDWRTSFYPGGIALNNEYVAHYRWYQGCAARMARIAAKTEEIVAAKNQIQIAYGDSPTRASSIFAGLIRNTDCESIAKLDLDVANAESKAVSFAEQFTERLDTVKFEVMVKSDPGTDNGFDKWTKWVSQYLTTQTKDEGVIREYYVHKSEYKGQAPVALYPINFNAEKIDKEEAAGNTGPDPKSEDAMSQDESPDTAKASGQAARAGVGEVGLRNIQAQYTILKGEHAEVKNEIAELEETIGELEEETAELETEIAEIAEGKRREIAGETRRDKIKALQAKQTRIEEERNKINALRARKRSIKKELDKIKVIDAIRKGRTGFVASDVRESEALRTKRIEKLTAELETTQKRIEAVEEQIEELGGANEELAEYRRSLVDKKGFLVGEIRQSEYENNLILEEEEELEFLQSKLSKVQNAAGLFKITVTTRKDAGTPRTVFQMEMQKFKAEINLASELFYTDTDLVVARGDKPQCSVWHHTLMQVFESPTIVLGDGSEVEMKKFYAALTSLPLIGGKVAKQQAMLSEIAAQGWALPLDTDIPTSPYTEEEIRTLRRGTLSNAAKLEILARRDAVSSADDPRPDPRSDPRPATI